MVPVEKNQVMSSETYSMTHSEHTVLYCVHTLTVLYCTVYILYRYTVPTELNLDRSAVWILPAHKLKELSTFLHTFLDAYIREARLFFLTFNFSHQHSALKAQHCQLLQDGQLPHVYLQDLLSNLGAKRYTCVSGGSPSPSRRTTHIPKSYTQLLRTAPNLTGKMFYSQQILTKKGPLAKVWLAAHVHTKLTKAMALSTNVQSAVERIISPDAPMALRLTSQLLLGVVRIFSRKTKYLLADSSDALARLKLAYTPASSNDLADPHANPAAITLAGGGGGGGAGDGANSTTTSAGRAADLDGLPMPDLDFPEANSSRDATPRYLADAKDITIDDYASSGMNSFGRDPDLDLLPGDDDIERDRMGMDYDEAPLMFTPSQQRTPSTPKRDASGGRSAGGAESIERMRDAAMPGAEPATPRISLGFDDADEVAGEKGLTPRSGDEMLKADTPVKPDTPVFDGEDGVSIGRESLPVESPGVAGLGDDTVAAVGASPGALLPTDDLVLADDVEAKDDVQGKASEGGGESEDAVESAQKSGEAKAVPGAAAAEAARKASRKRKGGGVTLWDEETELPAQFVYETLQDTSDLIRPAKRTRPGGAASRGRTAKELFAQPVFPGLAPELQTFFSTVVFDAERIWREPGSPITADAGALEANEDELGAVEVGNAETSPAKNSVAEVEGEDGEVEKQDEDAEKENKSQEESQEEVEGDSGTKNVPGLASNSPSQAVPIEDTPSLPDAEPRLSFGDSMMGDVEDMAMTSPVPLPESANEPGLQASASAEDGAKSGDETARESGALTLVDVANTRVVVEDGETSVLGEAMISQRSVKMHQLLQDRAGGKEGQVSFTSLLKEADVDRRVAARSFYELLNLCGKQMVSLAQDGPYGDISVNLAIPATEER